MSAMTSPSPPSSALVEHISAHAGSLPSARRLRPYFLNSASERSASGPPAQKGHLSILPRRPNATPGASAQCMAATEIDFSPPPTPSLMVTTRRRLTPQGTSFSFLQAVTQPLHSMQRSASTRNFILAMALSLGLRHLTERGLGFLHHGDDVVAVG